MECIRALLTPLIMSGNSSMLICLGAPPHSGGEALKQTRGCVEKVCGDIAV